ncbi:TonB-dependent receptor [Leptobacterium flavescens]|uniref:TonB-dependent receptor n=1 Tax=Leptobacterium flavescens TaxID=472055 RepID=A0A6P0UPH9_9FLAO|nr:outer membrane beta-barrel family protein [Leptobacterium flavescens]NER12266.1 TonB-dependent receptor [Leptobacterium flavescens]
MKKLMTLCALVVSFALYSQGTLVQPEKIGTISGKVIDKGLNQPVAYATVVLKSKTDGSTIMGGITEDNGDFKLKSVPEGTHMFEVQFIGYKKFSQEIQISRRNRNVNLGTIALEEEVSQLEGVEVVAERSTIEQKVDRKVINIGKDLTTAGPTAADIMNNLPSVNVDQQTGNISLRGNSNVRVMVDGKLSNVPVAQLLRQIPSSSIKSIELITNPSAKYNPEGMSGLINIILHKNANIGFNGNINTGLTHGIEPKFNGTLDLNYRNGKFNVYGNYGHNASRNVNDGHIFRVEENSEQFFDFFDNRKSHLIKVGFDFFLNEKNTISFFTNQNIFDGRTEGRTNILYYNGDFPNETQFFVSDNENRSQQYNFDYKLEFAQEGHNIELEIDHNTFSNDEDADFRFVGGTGQIPDYMDFVDTERDQTFVNLDYVNPLNDKTKLELGVEARLFETEVDYESTGLTFNSSGVLRPTPDTNFIYDQEIFSAYATFGQNFEKWSYQIGARFEDVNVKADTNQVRSFTDKYTQIYPSAFLTYRPSEKNQYQVSFSRRVDRPGLDQVNPIREWATPLISSFGNQNLMPQFTNSVEMNYTRRLKKGSVTAGVFYRRIEDEINRAVYIDPLDENKLILTFDNFDDNSAYGFEMSSSYRPTKWWNFNASFDLFFQTQKGFVGLDQVEVDNTSWNYRMNNNFVVNKKLTFSLFGFYRGKNKTLQFDVEPMYFINAGARYSFAQGKGTLSLNFNDVFNTMQFAFNGRLPFRQTGDFNWESNTVYGGVSYRFGSGKNRALRRKNRDKNTKQSSGGIL